MLLVRHIKDPGGCRNSAEAMAGALGRLERSPFLACGAHQPYAQGFVCWSPHGGIGPRVKTDSHGGWIAAIGTPIAHQQSSHGLSEYLERVMASAEHDRLTQLSQCDGIWGIAYFDGQSGLLRVVTDRTAAVPFYWLEDDRGIWLSSSATAIVAVSEKNIALSRDALLQASQIGYLWGNGSLFEGINVLGIGVTRTVTSDGAREEPWWSPPGPETGRRNAQDLADELREAALTSLAGLGSADRKVHVSLTGGLDSRCVCALAQSSGVRCDYFTGRTSDGEEESMARRVADLKGLPWRIVDPADGRHGDYSELLRHVLLANVFSTDGETHPLTGLSQWSYCFRHENAVMHLGQGGEILRDYWSRHERAALLLKGRDPMERLLNYRSGAPVLPLSLLREDIARGARERLLETMRACEREVADLRKGDRLNRLYVTQRMRRWAGTYLRMNGRWSTPGLPLFNQGVVEFSYRLPAAARTSNECLLRLLWQIDPSWCKMPINGRYSACPKSHRGWAGFLGDAAADAEKLFKKLRRGIGAAARAASADRRAVCTNRSVFGPYLDYDGMVSRFLYEPEPLRTCIRNNLDREPNTTMALIAGWEALLRELDGVRTVG